MNRFSSPGRTMEESLEEVLAASDANLATLERKKRAAQGAPITRNQYIEAKRLLAPELYQTTTRSRPSSAPRGASLGASSTGRTVAFEDEGNYEQKSEESIDRRFDAFLRKQRLMEDRLKKLENQKIADSQTVQQLHEENTKILEEQKHDHRTIHSLKSQLSSLKTKVELLVSNEEQREAREARSAEHNLHNLRSSQPSPLPLPPAPSAHTVSHSNTHTNYTTSVSNAELSAQIAEAVRAHYKTLEHSNTNNTTTNANATNLNTTLNTSTIFARSNNESIHSLEKECIRLSAEFDRTKTRLTTLDHAYSELKNTTSIRESRAEEAHKRAVNQYRVEVETFLSSAARKTADALTSIHANTLDINALRSDLDSFIDRTGSVLAEIDTKLTQHDSSIEEIYSVLERVEHSVHNIKHNMQEHDSNILRFVEDSVTIAKLTHTTEQHARTLALHNERIDHINIVCDTNTSAIDAHTVPIDILAKSIDSINDKFESRTDTLHHTIQSHHTTFTTTFDELHTTHKRTRAKVRELTESIKAISTIRQSIDSVLAEVDNRAKQDASWTYSFKAALQRVEGRVLSVERALNPAGALLREDSADDASTGAGDDKEPATPSKSTLPLHTTQFDQLRSLISSLRSELTSRNEAECSALRESVVQLVEERLTELEGRCQEQMEETRSHCEQYTEDQLQSSLDYVNNTIDTLHTSIADVHTLFDSLSSDVDSLGSSLRAEISGVDGMVQPLREQVLVVENRIDSVCGDVASVQEQVSSVLDLPERVNSLELLCSVDNNNSGDIVTLTTLSAHQAALTQQLQSLHTLHTTTAASTTSALNMLDNQYSDLAERLEQCNTIIYGQESALNECTDTLQNEVSNMQDSVLDVLSQLGAVRDNSREQLEELNQEILTLKQDLSAHTTFTNDCVADLQTTFEEQKINLSQQIEKVKVVLQGQMNEVQATLEHRVDGVVDFFNTHLHEVKEEVAQNDAAIHSKLGDLSTLHSTEHSTTTTAIAALHTTLAMQDSSAKSRVSAVEKRVAGQEGATRERVVALEVKLSTLEDSLRTHIAAMQGTLHSQTLQIQTQSEQLQQSVPLHTMRAQDTELSVTLTSLFTEQCDALKAQLIVLRERVEECEGRVSTTEVELTSAVDRVTAQYNTLNTTLHAYIDSAIATTTTTNATALVTLTNDILSTVDDRNNSMRELVYQLHEIVGTQQDEHANTTNSINTITTSLTALESSIQSTDHLLSEHVNDTTSKYTTLNEVVNSKCNSDEVHALVVPLVLPLVTPLLTQLQDTVTSDYSSAVDVLTNTLHNVENEVVRRCMQTEHALGTLTNTTTTLTTQLGDVEQKQVQYEADTTQQLATLSATLSTMDASNANNTNTIAALAGQHDALSTELSTINTTLGTKISDNTQLLQLYEKRLRTAEKAIETRYSELSKHNSEHHALLTTRINTVGSSAEQCSTDYKQSVNSLTLQLLSIQAQLNDHSDEVRALIDQELSALRENVNTTLANHSSTSGSTRVEEWISSGSTRLEEWIQTLQSSHEDHLSLFDTTVHAIEQRIGSVEGSVDNIHTTLDTLRGSVDSASSAHNSTLLELHNELQDFTTSTKTRISSVEQRLIRSEAGNKEKLSELDNRIQHNTIAVSTMHTALPELQTQLAAHASTLAKLSSSSDSVHAVQQRMQHIEEKIEAFSGKHNDKIGAIEAYVHEQVKAVQGRTNPDASTDGGVKRDSHPHAPLPTTSTSASTSAPTAEEADLSHISRVTLSPLRRTLSGTAIGDVLDQRVRLTTHRQQHEDSVLLAETGILDTHAVDLGYESELFDDQDHEQNEHHYDNNDNINVEGGRGDSSDEQDNANDNAESLQQFHSMIETVNFDIATLGVHLKSFQPDQESSSRRAALQTQLAEDQERQELERQAAVENLQLKKFNHRRKFQRVLFEKQG